MLNGKRILLGVCGGIAAYKVADLASKLTKLNADVHVVMTDNATEFVAPLTFRSITGNKVTTEMFDEPEDWNVKHVSLSQSADLVVIAPATANIIGKLANGIADDFLTTAVMATKAQVMLCPSMNSNMYLNPITQKNIETLREIGYWVVQPDKGELACGDVGIGRLPEPAVLSQKILEYFTHAHDLSGKTVIVTAGPTQEALDPVRFISNHSSGKMGYAIAEAAERRGAKVILVSGPVSIAPPDHVELIRVTTAKEMLDAVRARYAEANVVFFIAAAADYRTPVVAENKMKKLADNFDLVLVKNEDIALEIGKMKQPGRVHVGACAETKDLEKSALEKLKSKNFDIIMANDVGQKGAGFGVDTNIVTIFDTHGAKLELDEMPKIEVAHKLLNHVISFGI
ncbi:MAG: bifunctional phosphopantothenoylcysteine decarboxylase/phosphopantothenate--cysteine ligase CoaBC [Clostridia bacterium]